MRTDWSFSGDQDTLQSQSQSRDELVKSTNRLYKARKRHSAVKMNEVTLSELERFEEADILRKHDQIQCDSDDSDATVLMADTPPEGLPRSNESDLGDDEHKDALEFDDSATAATDHIDDSAKALEEVLKQVACGTEPSLQQHTPIARSKQSDDLLQHTQRRKRPRLKTPSQSDPYFSKRISGGSSFSPLNS